MVGVYLSVWVRRGVLLHVRGVQVTSVGTGMMGYLGNKGSCPCLFSASDHNNSKCKYDNNSQINDNNHNNNNKNAIIVIIDNKFAFQLMLS